MAYFILVMSCLLYMLTELKLFYQVKVKVVTNGIFHGTIVIVSTESTGHHEEEVFVTNKSVFCY